MAEMETQLEISVRLGYAQPIRIEPVLRETVVLKKQLYALRNALLKRR
jgi:hypothetical protein